MTDDTPPPKARWAAFFRSVLTTVLLPLAIIGGASLCAGAMFTLRPRSTPEPPEVRRLEVVGRPLEAQDRRALIRTTGTVTGARTVRLLPEVPGKIVRLSPNLVPGGRVRRGELLAQLDPRNYEAAVAQQEQLLAQAELNLSLELNRASVARREWELLGRPERSDPRLAQREPHVEAARKAVDAAKAALRQARANLERTRLTAPFDALVVEEAGEVGQVLQPGTPLATLVGTEAFWVQISLPMEKLEGLGFGADGVSGSPVVVEQRLANGTSIQREGHLLQLMGQLDPQTRTAQLLVEIPDPLEGDGLPLLPGAFVDVSIEGGVLRDTWEIPRSFLRDGTSVWVVDHEGALRRRDVEVGWRTADTVIVTSGFEPDDQLVLSPLRLPIEGQPVTVIREEEG